MVNKVSISENKSHVKTLDADTFMTSDLPSIDW